ncbi:lipopolysaccharide biosynthesis protein [Vibrio breoganii]
MINRFFWSAVEILFTRVFQLIVTIFLARILSPNDFGIIAIIMMAVSLSQVVVDGGISSALIRKNTPTDEEFSTAFIINIVMSILLYVLIFLLSPYISGFYQNPLLTDAIRICSVILIVNAFAFIPRVIFTIRMDYLSLGKSSIVSSTISGSIAIYLANNDWQYWALVSQVVTGALLNALILNLICKKRINISFNLEVARELFKYGYKILLSGLLEVLFKNIYIIILGKIGSSKAVGYFSQSDRLSLLPIISITQIFQRVNFQIMVKVQNDVFELSNVYRISYNLFVVIFVPICVYMASYSDDLISLLLGQQWNEISLIFSIMIISYIFLPLGSVPLNILKAIGRSDIFLKTEIKKKVVILVMILPFVSFGITGLSLSMLFSSVVSLFISINAVNKFVNIRRANLLMFTLFVFVVSITTVALFKTFIFSSFSSLTMLLGGFIIFIVLYAFIVTIIFKKSIFEIVKFYSSFKINI